MAEQPNVNYRASYLGLVVGMLALAVLACSFNSPSTLNEGQGTASDPVPLQKYARTSDYDIRALSVVRPIEEGVSTDDSDLEYMRVQFQIRCTKDEDEICDLSELRRDIKLVDKNGIIYDPALTITVDRMLEGQILGGAEKAGWQVYRVPEGLVVGRALAEYGQDHRVFFMISTQE
jgi:hypothetical protein